METTDAARIFDALSQETRLGVLRVLVEAGPCGLPAGIYASLRRRLEIFISLPFAALDRMAMRHRLDEIGAGPFATAATVSSIGGR